MKLEVARALRLHESRRDTINDHLRVFERDGRLIAVLVSGSETGWDSGWLAGQRLLLDQFAAAHDAGEDLATGFERAAAGFVERAGELDVDPNDDFFSPSAEALAVSIVGSSATVAWLGRLSIVLVRDGRVLARSPEHTLGHRRPELAASELAGIVARVIRPGAHEPEIMQLDVQPGDRLLLVDGRALEQLTQAELCRDLPPQELAEILVDLSFERCMRAHACCVIEALRELSP
ncbi:MAG: hypothetical protein R6X02_10215 [Enhygromyxa sp.]